jgi:hypothetical protein
MNDDAVDVDESYLSSNSAASMLFDGDAKFGKEVVDDEIGITNYTIRAKKGLTKCKKWLGKLKHHCWQSIEVNILV